ncbi:MAG TPA: beta-eliminating lyase-related protein [Ornithinibacter sp.]|nr:beta-eliminating lyase-related protein [Ornithinibacter sp.]
MAEVPQHPLTHAERARAAERGLTRSVPGVLLPTPAEELGVLADVAASLADPRAWDRYGEHGPVAALERRVADLLGMPAAAMFPSGVMAQQSMLRVWCDTSGSRRVAIPGLSHLLRHEGDGPRLLHGFDFALLTDGPTVPLAEHLTAIPGVLGAVLLELPLRDAGHLLPTWDELVAFSRACRERGVPLHLDGARIWESAPGLGHTPAEVAALADSVYVSLYKGLGGLAGAVVAGPEDEVAQARVWRTRMGGTLFSLMPYAVAGLRGLDRELPRMAEYHERAVLLAQRLEAAGIRVTPQPPHTNAFRIHVERDAADLDERRVVAMERDQVRLSPPWSASDAPGWSWTELTVGPATLQWDVDEAVETLVRVYLG